MCRREIIERYQFMHADSVLWNSLLVTDVILSYSPNYNVQLRRTRRGGGQGGQLLPQFSQNY